MHLWQKLRWSIQVFFEPILVSPHHIWHILLPTSSWLSNTNRYKIENTGSSWGPADTRRWHGGRSDSRTSHQQVSTQVHSHIVVHRTILKYLPQQGVFNGGGGEAKGSNRGYWRPSQLCGRTPLPVSILRLTKKRQRHKKLHRQNWQKASHFCGRTPLSVSLVPFVAVPATATSKTKIKLTKPVGELPYQSS